MWRTAYKVAGDWIVVGPAYENKAHVEARVASAKLAKPSREVLAVWVEAPAAETGTERAGT